MVSKQFLNAPISNGFSPNLFHRRSNIVESLSNICGSAKKMLVLYYEEEEILFLN